MFYLRAVRNYKKFRLPDFDVDSAAKALVDESDALSVYATPDVEMGLRIMALFAMAIKISPETVNFILIPTNAFEHAGLGPRQSPNAPNHPVLINSHHEVRGLKTLEAAKEFAIHLRDAPNFDGRRVMEKDLINQARIEVNDPDTGAFAMQLIAEKPKWKTAIFGT